jgi:membrane protease YdiL (CAAX protease family)
MKLNYFDGFFLSVCAGVGEELLFRSGMQYYAGIWITSLFFVAIHGYFSIKKPLMSLYGLVVLPFILLISIGFNHFGLWFSIAAHFAYDMVLMFAIISDKGESTPYNR